MPVFIDQTGRPVTLPDVPVRIVSLVPSQTELLFDLGLDTAVVGITKFCIHPLEWFNTRTRVGGTKQLKMEVIRRLGPDLIIANKEENLKEQIEELQKDYPVWISDVSNFTEAREMIQQLGLITGKEQEATDIIEDINTRFGNITATRTRRSAAYLIWQNPYMTVGGDTFIHAMLEIAGFDNVFKKEQRYPVVSIEELRQQNPQVLMLSSEPFPFSQKHLEKFQSLLPATIIIPVDGEMFSWYGSRLLHAPAYFEKLQKGLGSKGY